MQTNILLWITFPNHKFIFLIMLTRANARFCFHSLRRYLLEDKGNSDAYLNVRKNSINDFKISLENS